MKKTLSLLLVLALVLPTLTGCRKPIDNSAYVPTGDALLMEGQDPDDLLPEEENDQELNLAYYPDRSLNPLFGSDYTNRVLMSLMYQGLFAVDNKKNVTPILCGSYKVDASSRNWTFYVDSNATFSDGSKVRAEDVLATYRKAKENDYYKNRFYHLLQLDLTEDGTGVIFRLDTAFENLPLLLDIPIVKSGTEEAELPLGTGPYTFVQTNSGAHLQRVANWWCGTTKIPAKDPTINLVAVSTPADVRDAFQFGGDNSLSVVCTNPMSDSFAEYRCDYELWEIESGYFMYIGCNILYSDFFEDGTLRTYLTYAIDRLSIAEDTYNNMVYPVTLPCSPESPYYYSAIASTAEYDPLKFIGQLSTLKIPTDDKGVKKELRILVNSDDSARTRIARQLAENLTEMGLPATTLECSGVTYKNVIYAANFDIYLGMTRMSPNFDMSEFFRPYGEMSKGGLDNPNLYNMVLNALENSGTYYNLYDKLAKDGRVIPVLFGYYAVYAQRGLMPDLQPSRDNVFYYSLGKTMDGIRIETVYEED